MYNTNTTENIKTEQCHYCHCETHCDENECSECQECGSCACEHFECQECGSCVCEHCKDEKESIPSKN